MGTEEKNETPNTPLQVSVPLDEPIFHGKKKITEVTIRKPNGGALRDTTLVDVSNVSVNALMIVLPRITSPTLTKQDVQNMNPADLAALGTEVSNFLLPKASRV